ncbi:hypothetical protein BDZ94DRAFT_238506 [Collybia nuda]|uniref:Uncharacterized protein n=1 Tax=Collybia nuda TaxID=64659 RepID=A0A9P5XX52_9AGAR|nr:hypothetical protein BDZ94DRAFT_238506 [Collybia nuda]
MNRLIGSLRNFICEFFTQNTGAPGGGDSPYATEASYQTIRLITTYFEKNTVSAEDLTPLFDICRQLWTHPTEKIREPSLSLLEHCATWLSSTPTNQGAISTRLSHCAATILSVIHDAQYSNTIRSILSTHKDQYLHLVNSIDASALTYNIDVDGVLLSRDFDMTWKEGKRGLSQLNTPHPDLSPASSLLK